ncbi:MAG: response regulator transcription factor [Anaerolineales bacterium]|nr:response regulator transcription factor [Anaerolineales bacterium]
MDYNILLVEDDPGVAAGLRDGLEREGYCVVWKDQGIGAVEYALSHHPHLLILDIRLPDGSGFDFCRQLREKKWRRPILMLTVRDSEVDKVLGLEMGADDYLTKPYSLRELLSRVKALLRRSFGEFSNSEAQLLYIDDIVVDRDRSLVWRGDQEISLTPTEFRLLVFLARHCGQAFSREQILENVWGFDAQVESETVVNVYIRRLREKLEYDPRSPQLFLTVPGIGYRLRD